MYSTPEVGSSWILRCTNPIVNSRDAWFLGSAGSAGSSCSTERSQLFPFAKCGIKGKLWESDGKSNYK